MLRLAEPPFYKAFRCTWAVLGWGSCRHSPCPGCLLPPHLRCWWWSVSAPGRERPVWGDNPAQSYLIFCAQVCRLRAVRWFVQDQKRAGSRAREKAGTGQGDKSFSCWGPVPFGAMALSPSDRRWTRWKPEGLGQGPVGKHLPTPGHSQCNGGKIKQVSIWRQTSFRPNLQEVIFKVTRSYTTQLWNTYTSTTLKSSHYFTACKPPQKQRPDTANTPTVPLAHGAAFQRSGGQAKEKLGSWLHSEGVPIVQPCDLSSTCCSCTTAAIGF